MLKYKVRLTENDFKDNNIVWREKYVAPDLSFFSGVTDSIYHLERYKNISVVSPITNKNSIFDVETEVVTRTGYIIAKNKRYPATTFRLNSNIWYVEINGTYYYRNGTKFTIKNWQCETYVQNSNGRYIPKIVEKDVTCSLSSSQNSSYVKLDTIYWIEDGYVTIDGNKYIFDKNEQQPNGTKGSIRYTNNGRSIEDVTKCDSIVYVPYDDASLVHDVCKFKAYATPFTEYKPKDIKYCSRFLYVKYKEHYCPVIPSGSTFVCQVPDNGNVTHIVNYTVSAKTEDNNSEVEVTIGNDIQDINDLAKLNAFIKIGSDEYFVSNDYRESNSSKLIMVRLDNQGTTIGVGEEITFVYTLNNDSCYLDVKDNAVLYDGNKYIVEAKLFDKAKINGNEYDIVYDALDNTIAYVDIDGEQVPMKVSNGKVTRYGKVITDANSIPVTESYDIKTYSGVTIEGNKYIVKTIENSTIAELTIPNKIKFVVDEIKGNSLFICKASINPNDYSYSEIQSMQIALAEKVVSEQDQFSVQVNNKVLGTKPISKESVFSSVSDPKSSDDAHDILNKLIIENKNGYVSIPINMNVNVDNNLLRSETIKKDFTEREMEKAINRIVDLEKDVYTPKIMTSDNYQGSNTDFTPIHAINVNLHFRTRDLDSWKVNEDYNDVSLSGLCNWFITDYEPYKSMLEAISSETNDKRKQYKYTRMMESSDLLGFLNFTGNDVFYQKSKISKSFLRFSFYDSCDPQKQSLLATSSVFLNEHDLYKKYIDNSRKGVNQFLGYATTLEECVISNRIRVNTERLSTTAETRGTNNCTDTNDFVLVSYDEGGLTHAFCVSLKDDGKRLDSRLVIDNKYTTDTSSEGFYIYMFREYAQKLHPKPIYMKIEFNHAGIGKTIPFIVPMRWSEKNSDNEVTPERRVTLSNEPQGEDGISDLEYLQQGYPLSWVYAQSYIPLYAVYDFRNKEYGYVFDDRYINVNGDGTVTLNLFEIKIMEDNDPSSDYGTAVINNTFS